MERKTEGLFEMFNYRKNVEESKKEILNECMVEFRKRDLKNNQLFYTVIKKQEDLEGKVDKVITTLEKPEAPKKSTTDANTELMNEDVIKRLEEHVHVENVKCFKNVQASFNQSLTEKLTELQPTKKEGIASLKGYARAILFFLLVQIGLTIAFFLYYIGVIPAF